MALVELTNDAERRFSDVLEDLGRGTGDTVSLREMVAAFGERAFGAVILMLSLLALIPWPPGGKAVFAVPIILISLELAFQRQTIWMPRWVLDRSVSRSAYQAGVKRIIKIIRRVEGLTKPRLSLLTGEVADTVTGLVCVVLAVIMALPIPFGDALPGFALVLFSMGMMQRDGIAVLLGVLMTAICGLYLVLVWTTVVEITTRIVGGVAGLLG